MPAESDIPTELGPAVRALAVGQVVFGRYELRRKLGEGGFGAVWLVHDAALREEVAIKFVLQAVAASPEAIDGLKAEAARSRQLTHQNIVRIHDFVSDAAGDAHPELAGISMEYVAGESLAQRRLREPGKCFDAGQMAPWIDQLCQALTYAHAPKRRVIHRDLKPPNLLLTADGELKVADFGIACSLINSVTQISGRLSTGTPPFMSPQQVSGGWPAERDDIYSLGATIYMLLTSTPPFHQGDIVHQVMTKVPEPMRERRARLGIAGRDAIPAVWEETVAACLAKDPAQRPSSAEAVAQRLGLRGTPLATLREVLRRDADSLDERRTEASLPAREVAPVAVHRSQGGSPKAVPASPSRRAGWRLRWIIILPLLILAFAAAYRWWPALVSRSSAPASTSPTSGRDFVALTTSEAPSVEKRLAAPEEIRLPFPSRPMLHFRLSFLALRAESWGYVDGWGHEAMPAQWQSGFPFSEGRAKVEIAGRYGFLTPQGSPIIPAQWDSAGTFSEGLAMVEREGRFGFIDRAGELVISPRWKDADSFSEGLAPVGDVGAEGFIDRTGRYVLPPQWEAAFPFRKGLALVMKEGQFGYIGRDGHTAIPLRWTNARSFSEGMAAVSRGGKWGYADASGKLVIPTEWDSAGDFSEGRAAVSREGRSGFIDASGAVVIPLRWAAVDSFCEGVCWVHESDKSGWGKWGCIDRKGELIVPVEWDDMERNDAEDGRVYVRLARIKSEVLRPVAAGQSAAAEVRWVDSAGRVLWQSP